jgi:hypothetical protein
MDLSKLSLGDKVIAGSGLALFIFWFFPWFKYDFGGFIPDVTQKGTHFFFTGTVPMLLGLVMIAWVVATKLAQVDLPELPIPQGLLLLGMGGLAAILVVLRLLIGGDDAGTDVLDRTFGIFLATLAALGLAAGGFLKFQEDGGELPKSGGPQGGGNQPPTPF